MTKLKSAAATGSGHERHRLEPPPVTVLHVDDDPNDAELFRAASRKAGVKFILHHVEDAEHAMAYLGGQKPYSDRKKYPLPVLVLLDLKMPRASGFEVLNWVRRHQTLHHLPIVVLSGSELKDDIQQAYAVGATSYLVKPLGFDALVQLVKEINAAWVATLTATPGKTPAAGGPVRNLPYSV